MSALVFAAAATASLMLLSRGTRRFGLSLETKTWMALAWLLIIVSAMLIVRAVTG